MLTGASKVRAGHATRGEAEISPFERRHILLVPGQACAAIGMGVEMVTPSAANDAFPSV